MEPEDTITEIETTQYTIEETLIQDVQDLLDECNEILDGE